MSAERQRNGRFSPGNCANPNGRPRRKQSKTADAVILREFYSPIGISEGGKRKKISKLAANLRQIANQGAQGDLRAAKVTVGYAIEAERRADPTSASPALTEPDEAIVARFLERLRLCDQQKEQDDASPVA
jgi:hypothetical protein